MPRPLPAAVVAEDLWPENILDQGKGRADPDQGQDHSVMTVNLRKQWRAGENQREETLTDAGEHEMHP